MLEERKLSAYQSNEDMWKISRTAWKQYLNYMNELTVLLNSYHGTNYSVRYWQLTVGKWVQFFFGCIYTNFDIVEETVDDVNEFPEQNFSHGDNYRLLLRREDFFASMKNQIALFKKKYKDQKEKALTSKTKLKIRSSKRFYTNDIFSWSESLNAIVNDFQYLMSNENWFILKQILSRNQVDILESYPNDMETHYAFDLEMRKQLFLSFWNSELDFVFRNFLVWNFPFFYLEDYARTVNVSLTMYPSKKFKKIFVDDLMDYSSVYQDLYIALEVEFFQAKLICIQHGGMYGMLPLTTYFYEGSVADQFLTYGWGRGKYYCVDNIVLLRNTPIIHNRLARNLLLISTWELLHRLTPTGCSSYVGYREEIVSFLCALLRHSKFPIEWRSYSVRGKFLDVDNMKEDVLRNLGQLREKLHVDIQGSAIQRIQQARLIVLDHLSTTVLETIGADIPTIMFWNPQHVPLTDEARVVCNRLRKVGILHDTADSAANFIEEIFDCIETWWKCADVIAVKDEFKEHFSRTGSDILLNYASFFVDGKLENYGKYMLNSTDYIEIQNWKRKLYPNRHIYSIEQLKRRNVYLFGAGEIGEAGLLSLKENNINCCGFVDNDVRKIGCRILDCPVYTLDEYIKLFTENDIVVICVVNFEFQIKMQLLEKKIEAFISIWQLAIL